MPHYFDYNATAPVRPEVLAAMEALSGMALNASSVHAFGRKAKALLEDARKVVAEEIGAFASEVIFTASGTEANNWIVRAFPARCLFVSAIEHVSLLKTAQSLGEVGLLPVTPDGILDLHAVEAVLPKEGAFLVSVMLANNETGVLQPISELAALVHARGGWLHCDAVQALGKIPVDFTALGCDFMTLSAHKMGGPVGAAALVVKNSLTLPPFLSGGGQESNRRAGTENIAAITGFAKAVQCIDLDVMRRLESGMRALETQMLDFSDHRAVIAGRAAPRLPNTLLIALPGVSSETQLIRLDLEGIAVSAGSACSSGRVEASHVLAAMGAPADVSGSAIRISGGWATTQDDLQAVATAWKKICSST